MLGNCMIMHTGQRPPHPRRGREPPRGALVKRRRQQVLLELVRAESLASQEEIAARLERLGFPATQSTISRDLDELGLVRVRDAAGHLRYGSPDGGTSNGVRHIRSLLREFARSV